MIIRIEEIYEELDQTIYSDDYHQGIRVKHISSQATISKDLVEELRDLLEDEDGQENGDLLEDEDGQENNFNPAVVDEILTKLRDNGPIDKYASYDESDYAQKVLQDLPYEEDTDPGEIAGQRAAEKRSELLDEAATDIRELMEELLPRLLK